MSISTRGVNRGVGRRTAERSLTLRRGAGRQGCVAAASIFGPRPFRPLPPPAPGMSDNELPMVTGCLAERPERSRPDQIGAVASRTPSDTRSSSVTATLKARTLRLKGNRASRISSMAT